MGGTKVCSNGPGHMTKMAVLRNGLNRAYCSVSARLKCQF